MTSLQVVISVDGKIITDSLILKRFELLPLDVGKLQQWEQVNELSVMVLPLIIGGKESPTLTGLPGDFLKIPITFSLMSKKVKNQICYLRYQRK